MKTSNIIFTATILFFFALLISYNVQLRAEYNKGEFKKPFFGYTKIALTDFNKININAANVMHVRITPGNANAIYVKDRLKDGIRFKKSGQTLTINSNDERVQDWDGILIECPTLKEVSTDAIEVTDWDGNEQKQVKRKRQRTSGIYVSNFRQGALKFNIGEFTSLTLEKSDLDAVSALVNGREGSNLNLFDSKIGKSDVRIEGKNHLKILNTEILQRNEVVSDSSEVTLSGRIFKSGK